MDPSAVDPFSQETIESPFAFYESLRKEAPLFHVEQAGYYTLSRFEDIRTAALDPERFSSNIVAILMQQGDGLALMQQNTAGIGPVDVLAIQDPPAHGPQRKIVTSYLTRARTDALEGHVRKAVGQELDRIMEESKHGPVDWMEAMAFRIPMAVALHLCGLPESDRAQVKDWADHAIALLAGAIRPEELMVHMQGGIGLFQYSTTAMDPASFPSGETAEVVGLRGPLHEAVRAGEISQAEAVSIIMQVLIAGSDSSASLMGSAARMLAERPVLQQELRDRPELIPAFLEECLRLESPFQGHFRITTEHVELHGQRLEKGTRLMLLWGSANRDEAQFDRPDEVILDRDRPRSHLAFGYGIHLCLGASLARLEGRVVIEELLRRTSEVSIDGDYRHRSSVFVRTLETLPLRIRSA